MIIPNGHIEVKSKVAGGINPKTGYPVKATDVQWGEPIECQFSATAYDRLARVLGEAKTEQSYEVLIEEQPFEAEQVRLTDWRTGKVVGEFSIKQVEPLEAVGELRILI